MEARTETAIKEALGYLEAGNPDMATEELSPLFEYELDCPPLIFTSGCCNFWSRRLRKSEGITDSFERAEALLADWKLFMREFVSPRAKVQYRRATDAAQRGVFALALKNYVEAGAKDDEKNGTWSPIKAGRGETTQVSKAEASAAAAVYRGAALCCKKLGFYDKALAYLGQARERETFSSAGTPSADGTAQLADCYALCGGDRNAKLLFREAFYINPDGIDLEMLDSELIRVLIEKTETLGYKGNVLKRWVAVWGTLWGVFCVKRDIKATEGSSIRMEMFSEENKLSDGDKSAITPRLLNLYFWYLDYLTLERNKDPSVYKQINDILLKIKILDKDVYEVYIK